MRLYLIEKNKFNFIVTIGNLILLLLLTAQSSSVTANADFANRLATTCRIPDVGAAPVIDGILDDRIWTELPPVGDLHQVQPTEYGTPSENTHFWICHDDDNIYVAARMFAKNPEHVVARQHIQGKDVESDDQLHISIDPFNRDRNGYFFQVNPNGIRTEALITNLNSGFNANWKTVWYAESAIDEFGWTTEIRIPFKSLSFDPKTTRWGFNLGRVIRNTGEILAWSSYGNDVWEMGPSAMGNIEPISNIRQGYGLEYLLSGVGSHYNDEILGETDTEAEPSLDVFYKPSPTLNLAATFNTDFSATEVDDRIVNLTRFDVLLPEKRDFFLQDANRFRFGDIADNGLPFFSRRFGLDSNGVPIDIIGGIKVSGQRDNFNFGTLAIRQSASGEQTDDPDLLVVRASQDVFKESSLGLIYTRGNPTGTEDNRVAGIDFIYNNSNFFDSQIQGLAWYQQSTHGDVEDDAHGLGIAYPNASRSFAWKFTEIGEHFNPAMGFVNRTGIRQHNLDGAYARFFGDSWIQVFDPAFEYIHVTDLENKLQSKSMTLTPLSFGSRAGDTISLSFKNTYENLRDDFIILPGLTIPAAQYNFDRSQFQFQSAIARRFFAHLNVEHGDFFDGRNTTLQTGLGFRPVNRYLVKLSYEQSELNLNAGEATTRLFTLSQELALSDNWAWLLLAQYDNISRQAGINSRLRWSPTPEKEFFFVVNTRAIREEDDSFETVRQDSVIKFTYIYRL